MKVHDHVFSVVKGYSRGLATITCGCGKIDLVEVVDAAGYEALREKMKAQRRQALARLRKVAA